LVANEEFQHILRLLNTNVDGKQKIMFAMTSIKGIGRRYANICCKKADIDMNKRYKYNPVLILFKYRLILLESVLAFVENEKELAFKLGF